MTLLGLGLSGGKNEKTCLTEFEFSPKKKTLSLRTLHEKIGLDRSPLTDRRTQLARSYLSPDEALLKLLHSFPQKKTLLAVNVPLTLPPCIECKLISCKRSATCKSPASIWMQQIHDQSLSEELSDQSPDAKRPPTAYTQRPIEIWVRTHVFHRIPEEYRFDVDETLGGNKAPLAARMNFLQKRMKGIELIEAWPKLTLACLACVISFPRRSISSYRNLETGAHFREEILDTLCKKFRIEISEPNKNQLIQHLPNFEAFLCGVTAFLCQLGVCDSIPKGFPKKSGWVHYPQIRSLE